MRQAAENSPHRISNGVKARALDAAARILACEGEEALNLRLIAEKAGTGLASIYHYFSSKDEILLNLALRGFEDLRRDIRAHVEDPSYLSPMRGGARAFFLFVEARPQLLALMFNARLLARYEALRIAEARAFAAYETAVRADARIPAVHQENVAFSLWALGRGIAGILQSTPDKEEAARLLQKMLEGGRYLIDGPQ